MKVLEMKGVSLNYNNFGIETNILRNIDLEIEEGDFVTIVGPSGAGKSSLLYVMSGLEKPTSGSVVVGGKEITEMPDDELADFRLENLGFVFQFFNLISVLDVEENILLPVQLKNQKTDTVKARAQELIKRVGLEDRKRHLPSQLSGGQQQRVAVARALINDPQIIFADEPTGNLDSRSSEEIVELLKELCKTYHKTIIMVTHNNDITKNANKVIHITDGKIDQVTAS